MLADNILYFKKNNPDLLEWLRDDDSSQDYFILKSEKTKNGINETLSIEKQGQISYLHSKYDPIREAQSIIDQLVSENQLISEYHVIFWGLGLGYHLEEFVKRYPEVDFSIFEPSKTIFLEYLKNKPLSKFSGRTLKLVQCGNNETRILTYFNDLLSKVNKEIIICELSSYQKVLQEERTLFFEQLKSATQIKKNALAIDYVFKKRWVLNSVMNFSEVLKTPNVLMENNGCFRNKQAILIAAGPSLDLEIENLRRIKEEKLAYLFSVGSAISTLIEHGIYPDAMCTYDPQGINQKVFEKVYTSEITSIPMIFGSSVGFETLERYQGPKFHMITSQDTVSKYFLKMNDKQALLTVADAPSIAVMTFELLQKLGFEEIILVGQNLAFKDEAYYAGGIDYGNQGDKNLTDGLFEVMDVSGKNVLTNESLNRMRKELEGRIAQAIIPVINTTVGGAAIEGTNFQRLEEVMKRLNLPFEINEFSTLEAGNIYDVKFLISALLTMKNSYETYKEIIISIKQIVIKTDELMLNKNLKQSEAMYDKIDHLLNEFEKNQFAAVFEIPMHRVEHELLAVNLHRIKRERTGLQKIREQITYLDVFINQLLNGFETDAKIMMILEKAIRDYEMKLTKDSGVEE